MDNSYQYETEIDLKELLYSIFRKWRIIVVCGILCAIALGVYKYVDNSGEAMDKAYEDQVKAYEQNLRNYNNTMIDYDRAVREFETAAAELDEQTDRLDHFNELLEELLRIEDMTLSSDEVATSYMRIKILKEFINECEADIDRLEAMKSPAEPTAEEPEFPTKASAFSVKYVALGLVLGVFGAAFIVCVIDLMSDKVKDVKDITRRFDLRSLGAFSNDGKKVGKVFGFIDRIIIKVFGHESLVTEDETYALVAANFDNFALETPVKSILITGLSDEAKLKKLTDNMTSRTHGDIKFTFGKSPLLSTDTTKAIPEVDSVILAEERNRSTNAGVEGEIKTIRDMGKDIFGVVLL